MAWMSEQWSQYQDDAAAFFRSLGLTADVEQRVQGVRNAHDIDVWVTGKLQTFDVRWVVECKAWKTNVPKEKVMALQAIAQDVGADRAFLLSEKGFQAGAIRSAELTNITLTSLQDLREQTREYLTHSMLAALYLRLAKLGEDFHHATSRTIEWTEQSSSGVCMSGSLEFRGRLGVLEYAVFRALHGQFPVAYWADEADRPLVAQNLEHLSLSRSVSAASEESAAVGGADGLQRLLDRGQQCVEGPCRR